MMTRRARPIVARGFCFSLLLVLASLLVASVASASLVPKDTDPTRIVTTGAGTNSQSFREEVVTSVASRPGTSEYLAAYGAYDATTSQYRIMTSRLDRDGDPIGSAVEAVAPEAGDWHFVPRLFATRTGYLLVYVDLHAFLTSNATMSLRARPLDADGAPIAGTDNLVYQWSSVQAPGEFAHAGVGAVDVERNEVLVTWHRNSGFDAVRVSAQGVPLAAPQPVGDGLGHQSVVYNGDRGEFLLTTLSTSCGGVTYSSSYEKELCGRILQPSDRGIRLGGERFVTSVGDIGAPFKEQYSTTTTAATWDPIRRRYIVVYDAFERQLASLSPANNRVFAKALEPDLDDALDSSDDPIEWHVSHTAGFDQYSSSPIELDAIVDPLSHRLIGSWKSFDSRQNSGNPQPEVLAGDASLDAYVPGPSDSFVSAADGSSDAAYINHQFDVAINAQHGEALYAWQAIRKPDPFSDDEVALYSRAYELGFSVSYEPVAVRQGDAVGGTSSPVVPDDHGETIVSYEAVAGSMPAGLSVDEDDGEITGTIEAVYRRNTTLTGYVRATRSDDETVNVPVRFDVYPRSEDLVGYGASADTPADTGDPVNAVNGNVYDAHQDLLLPSRGLSIGLVRTYNSTDPEDGPFGHGWSGLYDASIDANPRDEPDGTTTPVATVSDHDGKRLEFERESDGSYTAPARVWDRLARETDGTWTLTRRNGVRWRFSSSGRLSSIVDRNDNALSFDYDTAGRLTEITDPLGREVTLSYTDGRVTGIDAPDGREYRYEYDSEGDLVEFEAADGATWNYEYDAEHRLTRKLTPGDATHPRGEQLFEYSEDGRATSAEGSDGHMRLEYEYDVAARETTVVDARDHASTYHYDERGMVTEIEDPDGTSLEYEYDSLGRKTAETDQRGETTDYTHDARGNVLTVKRPKPKDTDTELDRPTTTMTYGDFDEVETVEDPEGNTVDYDYDAAGNLLTVTDPKLETTTTAYNAHGQPTGVEDANGHVTSFGYGSSGDENGRLVDQEDARGEHTLFEYDPWGNITETTDPLGHTTTRTYDAADRLLTTTLPETVANRVDVVTNTYDPRGNLVSTEDPLGHGGTTVYTRNDQVASSTDATGRTVEIEYDVMGNSVKRTDPAGIETETEYTKQGWPKRTTAEDGSAAGRVTETTYRADGLPASTTDGRGETTEYEYDGLGRLVTTRDADDEETEISYDRRGLMTSLTNPNGHKTEYEYDARGDRVREENAEGDERSWTYDAVGNLTTATDGNGHVKTFSYDEDDRPVAVAFTGSSEPSITTEYDDAGRPTSLARGPYGVAYAYDEQGRITGETQSRSGPGGYSRAVEYEYDAAGRRTETTQPGASTPIGYEYDDAGRLVQVTDAQSNVTGYFYDTAGRLTQITHPGTGMDQQYAYNAAGEPETLTLHLGAGATRAIEYEYDKAGNVAGFTDARGGESTSADLDYDSLERLIGEEYVRTPTSGPTVTKTREYEYDASGNRTEITKSQTTGTDPPVTSSTTYSYDDAERMLTAGSKSYSYDGEGQLYSVVDSATSTTRDYSYNRAGELVGEGSDAFEYDPLGRRVRETSGSTTQSTVFDGDRAVQNYSGGTLSAEYTRAPSGGLVSRLDPAATTNGRQSYFTDVLDSTLETTSGGSTPEWSTSYDAFGGTREQAGTASSEFGYLGNRANPSGGTLDFNARSYDPEHGRFLSEDPIAGSAMLPPSLNPYVYGGGNPYTNPDPSGLCWGPTCLVESINNSVRQSGPYLATTKFLGNSANDVGVATLKGVSALNDGLPGIAQGVQRRATSLSHQLRAGSSAAGRNLRSAGSHAGQKGYRLLRRYGRAGPGIGFLTSYAANRASGNSASKSSVQAAGATAGGVAGGFIGATACTVEVVATAGLGAPLCAGLVGGGALGFSYLGESGAGILYDAVK